MKKFYLEFLRGISTVFILGWHIAFLAPTGHPTRLTAYWGTDALIMFFMLSGLVINLTESRKPKSIKSFLTNRFMSVSIHNLLSACCWRFWRYMLQVHSLSFVKNDCR